MSEDPCCTICMWPVSQACGICKSAHYCSPACRRIDAKSHDLVCRSYTEIDPRPSESQKKCILFPEHGEEPEVVWADFEKKGELPVVSGSRDWIYNGVDENYNANRDTVMSGSNEPIRSSAAQTNEHGGSSAADLVYSVVENLRNKRTDKAIKPALLFVALANYKSSVRRANETFYEAIQPFTSEPDLVIKGPVLAFAINDYESQKDYKEVGKWQFDVSRYADVTLDHFRDMVDYCIYYKQRLAYEPPDLTPGQTTVTTLTSVERRIKDMAPPTIQANVSMDGFRPRGMYALSPISVLLSLPMKLSAQRRDQDSKENRGCPYAAFLMMEFDVDSEDWGTIPKDWNRPGTVLVHAVDNTSLFQSKAACMARYCMEAVYPRVKDALNMGTKAARQEVVESITCQNMARWIGMNYPNGFYGLSGYQY